MNWVPRLFANAYHLMLRPGDEQVRDLGGLHQMCGYKNQAILTDSGGFQVYSLSKLRKVTDEGVKFRSHIDGSLHELSPERLVELQENLGPDIAMVLDECPPAQSSREDVIASMTRTTAWPSELWRRCAMISLGLVSCRALFSRTCERSMPRRSRP